MPQLDPALVEREQAKRDYQARINQRLSEDPGFARRIARRVSQWADVAPTLPRSMIYALAEGGIDTYSDTGKWIIKTGVPAVTARGSRINSFLSDPNRLHALTQLDTGTQDALMQGSVVDASHRYVNEVSGANATGLDAPQGDNLVSHAAAAVGDVSRPVFSALAAGAEVIQATNRNILSNTTPSGTLGVHTRYGSSAEVNNLAGQTSLGQAIAGKSLGQGFFPGGEAQAAAVKAQQAAASIDGHALTPGRALAAAVVQPGTKPYAIMSGSVDAAIALKGDPASIALSELGEVNAARRAFSPTGDAAIASATAHLIDEVHPVELRAWAGAGDNLAETVSAKIAENPGSLQELVSRGAITNEDLVHAIGAPSAGIMGTFRRFVDTPTALTWTNSKPGRQFAEWAGNPQTSGHDIYLASRKKMPVDVAWQLGDAHSADEVRTILNGHLGTDIAQPLHVRPFHELRLAQRMPNYAVDALDPNALVERASAELAAGKVPKSEWDKFLKPLALSQDRTDALNGMKAVGNRIGDEILARDRNYQKLTSRFDQIRPPKDDTGFVETPEYRSLKGQIAAKQRAARELTTYFSRTAEEDRQWWITATGDTPHVPGLSIDGEATPITGPYGVSELLNRGIPVIGGDGTNGVREIRRHVSTWAPLYANPKIGTTLRATSYVADHITGIWKTGLLFKAALPVRFLADEQARMASAGTASMFHSPLSYIAWVVGGRSGEGKLGEALAKRGIETGTTDILDKSFVGQMAERQSAMTRAVGRASSYRQELFAPDEVYSKGWSTFGRDQKGFTRAWADRISQAHVDPVGQAVARTVRDGSDLTAVKDAFWNGNLASAREDLVAADLKWGSAKLVDRTAADAYIDGWVQRLHDLTGGHDDLVSAVADGTAFGSHGIDQQFARGLRTLADQGIGPEKVVGATAIDMKQKGSAFRKATNAMFSILMDVPTQKLTRSPAFRQAYFKKVDELLPYLDDADRARIVERAGENGVRLTNSVKDATYAKMSLEQADTVAKGHALQVTHDSLYYPGERGLATDTLRNIIPFGEAWKNVLTKWAKLSVENPQTIRRVQQGVTAARESGFFYYDPAQKAEVYTVVPEGVMKHLAGVPFPITAPVKGLNIIGQGLPGFGPAVQIPAAMLLPHTSAPEGLKKFLLPYGSPDYNGGTFEQLFPGWLDKLKTTGWFQSVPFMGQSENQQRVLSNLAKQVYQYKMSTGAYKITDQGAQAKLWKSSLADAQKLYFWRGAAQFVNPSAPNVEPQTQMKDGSLLETWKMTNDYRTMLDAHQGDEYGALLEFVGKYGPDRVFANEPQGLRTIYGVPTTAQGLAWREQHTDFARKYPNVYGYWVPQGGGNDNDAYVKAVKRGDIQAMNGPEGVRRWSLLADARLGNAIYDTVRKRLPASLTQEQTDYLATVRQKIKDQYPGFQDESIQVSRATRQNKIDELRGALKDKTVAETPLAHAATVYLAARDRVLAEQKNRGSRAQGVSTSKNMQDLRDWLFQVGDQIATQMPEFTTMWNYVFQGEVAPKDTTDG